jgi:hypothetical protein
MRPIALAALAIVILFVNSPAFAADPLVVDLWPGKTPGDAGIKVTETSRIHQSPLVGPTKLVTNVTKPTLTIYRPSTEKNTKTAMLICPGGGYWDLYWELEGEEVAAWLNSVGMTGNSAFMYIALKRAGIAAELHIFATGDHDFGVRQNDKLPSSWTGLCVKWLRNRGLLAPALSLAK